VEDAKIVEEEVEEKVEEAIEEPEEDVVKDEDTEPMQIDEPLS
jgi:hypothetical protein